MHRFVWDLHYALPKGVRRSFWGPRGPSAVPGEYTVKLTASGKSSTQPLTIKLDPRVKTPQDALVRQFGLASKLADRLGEASAALQQANDLRKQIDARKKEASGSTELLAALEELERKLEAATEADSDAGFGLFGLAATGKYESLANAASALSRLLVVVDGSELGPVADAAMASASWDEAAQGTLSRVAALDKLRVAGVAVCP